MEERAKFFAKTIAAQRKFRATQRSAKIRSRPPTKSQLRNLMMTKRVIDDFKPMDSDEQIKILSNQRVYITKGSEEAQHTKYETNVDLEEEEQLRAYLKIVPDEEGIIDYEVLENRTMIDANAEDELWPEIRKMNLKTRIYMKIVCVSYLDNSGRWSSVHQSNRHQELAIPEQTASDKDFSNPLIADSLLKTIWFSTHHASQYRVG
ncbi:hypothetical protein Tco_0660516 [Tanacetum coccineum]